MSVISSSYIITFSISQSNKGHIYSRRNTSWPELLTTPLSKITPQWLSIEVRKWMKAWVTERVSETEERDEWEEKEGRNELQVEWLRRGSQGRDTHHLITRPLRAHSWTWNSQSSTTGDESASTTRGTSSLTMSTAPASPEEERKGRHGVQKYLTT